VRPRSLLFAKLIIATLFVCFDFGFWFLVCYSTTQLATQLQQAERCIQVVCSNEEARKRLTESNGTPAMDPGHIYIVLK